MEILNLSAEPLGKLYAWLPHDLTAETVVFLPDACPGKSPLPTGTAVLTRQPDWRRFAVSDCGCGMRLVRSQLSSDELTPEAWDAIADALRRNKGSVGDLGGGNHFLDALAPYAGGRLHLLIHTGSRAESGHVDGLVDEPDVFDAEFDRAVAWAEANRAAVHDAAASVLGPLDLVLDLPHNTYEEVDGGGAIIRKGSVRVEPGDLNVIPSHMSGDVALVRATERVRDALCSLSHGTGRAMSRADCKPLADSYDFAALRARVLLPAGLEDASLRTDGPFAYRDLDTCLALLEGYIEEVQRFAVVGYMGHL
jgi:RNA-splicing ligase RtcB